MTVAGGPIDPRLSLERLRLATGERLRGRKGEIDETVIHRVLSVAPPTGREIPGYVEALRAAIPSALDHAFEAIEIGEERLGPTPSSVLAQAAASARSKVGLEVVLRRYATGYSTLCDFLHQEVGVLAGYSHPGHTILRRELTALFDRLVVEVSDAYRREEASAPPSPRRRRTERVRRLLAGELVDPAGLDYPMTGSHLAVIISGEEPEEAAAHLAKRLGRRLLVGEDSPGRCAAWLGGTRPLEAEELDLVARPVVADGVRLSFGSPGEGLTGWRRSLRQAEAAELVAGRNPREEVVHYRHVPLLAAALRDPDLAHFLRETYVEPLNGGRSPLGATLITYLALDHQASATAAALGISRQTVTSRLRVAEERLGQSVAVCAAALETALRLAEQDTWLCRDDETRSPIAVQSEDRAVSFVDRKQR